MSILNVSSTFITKEITAFKANKLNIRKKNSKVNSFVTDLKLAATSTC